MTDDNNEELTFSAADQALAWETNALLMALHEGSIELYESILDEAENLPGLLVMATATLKSMVDYLLAVVNESGMAETPVTFGDLIHLTAEFLTTMSTDE